MSWNNDNEKISLTWKEALLSFATLSVFDEHHRHLSASMSGSKIRENMNVVRALSSRDVRKNRDERFDVSFRRLRFAYRNPPRWCSRGL